MITDPWLNIEEVLSYNKRHNFLVGKRGIGKTYSTTEWLLKQAILHDKPFIWCRNTKAALDELTKFNGIGFLSNHPKKMGLDPAMFTVAKHVLFYGEKEIGAFLSLGNFFSVKGIDHARFKNFVFDEFMPERREASRVDYDYALKSIMQSVFRDRTDFRAFYMANVLNTSCSILEFFHFNISPIFPGQIKQVNNKLNAIIFYLQNRTTEDTAKGDAFALANKHTDSSIIINYENNIDKTCSKDMKQIQKMAYMVGDHSFFLLREFKDKVAVISVKKRAEGSPLPCYALNKKFVFDDALFDIRFKQQILRMWNTNVLVFKSHYTLYQFTNGLFMQ